LVRRILVISVLVSATLPSATGSLLAQTKGGGITPATPRPWPMRS
jgi:hypothetical protein